MNKKDKKQYRRMYYLRHRRKEIDLAVKWGKEHLERRRINKRKSRLKVGKDKLNILMNQITKEILQYIVDNYGKKTIEEMSKDLGVDSRAIMDWACVLRKTGIDIPKSMHKLGTVRVFVIDYLKKHPGKRVIKQ